MMDVQRLIPRNKTDIMRAEAAVKEGFPITGPILPELLEWLKDCIWTVASVLSPFLASIGKPLIPYIREIMATDDEIWKTRIICCILENSQEVALVFQDQLQRLVQSPRISEAEEELPEAAHDVLEKHGWA